MREEVGRNRVQKYGPFDNLLEIWQFYREVASHKIYLVDSFSLLQELSRMGQSHTC